MYRKFYVVIVAIIALLAVAITTLICLSNNEPAGKSPAGIYDNTNNYVNLKETNGVVETLETESESVEELNLLVDEVTGFATIENTTCLFTPETEMDYYVVNYVLENFPQYSNRISRGDVTKDLTEPDIIIDYPNIGVYYLIMSNTNEGTGEWNYIFEYNGEIMFVNNEVY